MSNDGTIQILIPTPLRQFTSGEARVEATGATVGELLADLGTRYPGLQERVCEPDGRIRRFVNVFVNGENVRDGNGADTAVRPGDAIPPRG